MSEHRYILEPYKGLKSRYTCPSCQHKGRTFTHYIDTETGYHIAPAVGRCNRESNCGYHYKPKQYFEDNGISFESNHTPAPKFLPTAIHKPAQKQALKPTSYIDFEAFKASLNGYENNKFVSYLIKQFGTEVAFRLVSSYYIGSSKLWDGATVFWQLGTDNKIRTGKIMLYNASTGKRIKEQNKPINWVHKVLNLPNYELRQCLFGEHLLNDINKVKPVAIVESEKTAILASAYLPQFIWLATGGLSNLNAEKCTILKGRTVTLFPDLNGFEKWSNKAKELQHIASFQVSDLLEKSATDTEREQGLDLADYLLRFQLSEFVNTEPLPPEVEQEPLPTTAQSQSLVLIKPADTAEWVTLFEKLPPPQVGSWDVEIADFENFSETAILPSHPVRINPATTIQDVGLFIKSHLATVKANNGKKHYLPYLERLQALQYVLTH
jgi:rubredoxin